MFANSANHHLAAGVRRLAMSSALAAALLVGSASESGARDRAEVASASGRITALIQQGQTDLAINLAEQTLVSHPDDSTMRALLGQAYLRAGRFSSAAAALGDAVSLGDESGRTALGLALAQIAIGQTRDAIATLDRASSVIPAGDFGLALALAGDASRGVTILSDAVRGGGASPKLRQNLAYAFALDGRWTEARLTASFDVPGDQIDARLEQWAMSMRVGGEHQRIATLLGVPVRDDIGLPAALVMRSSTSAAALAAQDAAPAPAAAVTDSHGELPAVAEGPAAAPAPVAVAVADPAPVAAPAPVLAARSAISYVSIPVVQALPQANFAGKVSAKPVQVALNDAPPAAPASNYAVGGGAQRFVQLGAFSTSRRAQHAMGYFLNHHPQLSGHQFVVTRARVHGHNFWRVAVAGFDASGANGLCSSVRHSGGACFAYAPRSGTGVAQRPVQVHTGPALAVRR